ncbi:MAG TPA: thiamine phosphate synthase [Burkholderiales bacterium]|nr:thiamine phosphate synthase [Burkholderiales bacterium]
MKRGLYAVTPEQVDLHKVRRALDGGIALLQYRAKPPRRDDAARIVELARAYDVPVIVNDAVELARASGAAGVHLGRDDAAVAAAKKDFTGIVGASCYDDIGRARAAVAAGADYVAFGSVFASATKPLAVRAPLSLFRQARPLGVPLAAIGGITLENAPQLVEAGADLLAVITDLFDAPDITVRARSYARLFQ